MIQLKDKIRACKCQKHSKKYSFIHTAENCQDKLRGMCHRCVNLEQPRELFNIDNLFEFLKTEQYDEDILMNHYKASIWQQFKLTQIQIFELLEQLEIKLEAFLEDICGNTIINKLKQQYFDKEIKLTDVEAFGQLLGNYIGRDKEGSYQQKEQLKIEQQKSYIESIEILLVQYQAKIILQQLAVQYAHEEIQQVDDTTNYHYQLPNENSFTQQYANIQPTYSLNLQEQVILSNKIVEQRSIASRVPQLEAILKQEQNNLNMTRYNSNQTIAELSNTIQSLEKAKFELENKLRKAEKDKSDSDMKNQQKLKDQEVDIQGLKYRLQNLTSEKNDLQQEKAQLIEQKTKALSELEKQADSQSKHKENEEADLRKKNKTLNIEKTRLETIQNLKNQIDIQDQSIAKSAERFNQVMEENKQANDIMQSKNDYQVKVIQELKKKIPNHYKPKILGVVEQLKGKYAAAITDFAKDPSGSLTDVKFKIWKVEINQKELEKKLIQEGNLLINDLVKLTALADIEGKRTVNAIVSKADLQQGFIFQNSKPEAQIILPPHFDNKEAAAQQVINNLLVDFMINDLNNQLVANKDPKFDVKVAPQYVVQIAGEPKFYHAELLIDGPFTKFNGGEFPLQTSEQGQIANTLTYYSFKRTRGKLCISHLQSLGNTYYDAIVSSEYGLIGQADLGHSEILQVVDKIEKGKPEFLHPTFAKIRSMFR